MTNSPVDDADETTVVALLRGFLHDDREAVRSILASTEPRLLLGAACAWFNGLGITEYGKEEWDRRLLAFLEASRQ
jgi:hypothetical protein